ncbi:MAG: hypothetical protein Q8N94_03500 [Methanoregula sp.]|nr:hypothetical protein [Methanoregula sp.]
MCARPDCRTDARMVWLSGTGEQEDLSVAERAMEATSVFANPFLIQLQRF